MFVVHFTDNDGCSDHHTYPALCTGAKALNDPRVNTVILVEEEDSITIWGVTGPRQEAINDLIRYYKREGGPYKIHGFWDKDYFSGCKVAAKDTCSYGDIE